MKVFASVLIVAVCLSGKIFNTKYFNFKFGKAVLISKHLLYNEVYKLPNSVDHMTVEN